MGYRKNQINSPNYSKFGETVTHQLFGTSSSITPHAHQKTVFIRPQEKKRGHSFTNQFIMVKKIRSFDLNQNFPPQT